MYSFSHLTLVFLGGGLGATSRWLLDGSIKRIFPVSAFPYGIFIVNMIGCFLIGILAGVLSRGKFGGMWLSPFLITGFLGAFTTFSSFTLHLVEHHLHRQWSLAVLYAALSVFIGFSLALSGFLLSKN